MNKNHSANNKPTSIVASKSVEKLSLPILRKKIAKIKYDEYGNIIVIDHKNGETTLYAHLSQILVISSKLDKNTGNWLKHNYRSINKNSYASMSK